MGLCVAAALAAGCGRRSKPPPPTPTPAKEDKGSSLPESVVANGITWAPTGADGRTLWDLHAEKGKGVLTEGKAELENVRCLVYSQGQAAMETRAPRVQADYAGKSLLLLGGVTARTLDGKRSFRSDQVSMKVKEGKQAVIEASGTVHLDIEGTVLNGGRLVTDAKLRQGEMTEK